MSILDGTAGHKAVSGVLCSCAVAMQCMIVLSGRVKMTLPASGVWLEYHNGFADLAACMHVLFVGVTLCIHSAEPCHLRVCHELKIVTSTLCKQRQSVAEHFD